MMKEDRQVSGFNKVEVRGSGELVVDQIFASDQQETLTIEADEEVLEYIKSEVNNQKLVLEFRFPWWDIMRWMSWFSISKKVRYHVTMREVKGFAINGSGKVSSAQIESDACHMAISGSGTMEFGDLECDMLSTMISGSGKYILAGEAKRHETRISGSGRIMAADLITESTQVVISGSGYAEANAEEELDVSISGSGTVRYRGEPSINQSISGAGSVSVLK